MALNNVKNYDDLKQITSKLVDATSKFSGLLERGTHVSEAKMFRNKSTVLSKGLFNLMTLGAFKTGKSTLVNSVIGMKVVKTKALACSAVVTEVTAGKDTNHATVYYRDSKQKPAHITLQEFIDEYALTVEDAEEAINTGHIARFENIDHAVIESDSPFFEYGLTLIDSPGLEDRDTCTEITNNYLSKADAVIYTLRADGLFTKTDKEYLNRTYGGKNPNNVFFIVNRINVVPKDEVEDVKATTKVYLKGIFTDENGNFNADLYNRRVFFVNALAAYEGKLPDGDPAQYETSGVPEFEAELERFLLSGERYAATLQTALTLMADSYVRTQKDNETTINSRSLSLADLQKNHVDAVALLESLDKEIKDLQHLFTSTKENIVSKLMLNLNDYISEMESQWEEDCAAIENRIGFVKLFKLAGAGAVGVYNKEKKKEIQDSVLKPLTDEIGNIFEAKLNAWGNRVPALVDSDMQYLDSSIKGIMGNVSIKLDDATRLFLGEKTRAKGEIGGGNGVQLLLAAIQGNINDIVYISGGGKLNWKEFITTYVVQGVVQVLIFTLIGGPLGIAAFLIMEAVQTMFRAGKMNDRILRDMKDKLFVQLRDGTRDGREKIYDALSKQFDPICDATIKTITANRDEAKKQQEKILADRKKSESEFAAVKANLEETLAAMGDIIIELSDSVLGNSITHGDIYKLAAK